MSLSRRAKRGIAAFNSRLKSPQQMRYCSKKLMIEMKPQFDINIVSAAQAAAEAINASVQIVPKSEGYTVTPDAQGSPEPSVRVELQAGQEAEEGSETSAEFCGGCGIKGCEGDCDYDDSEWEGADDI